MFATVTLADRTKVGAVVASVRKEMNETAASRYRHDCRRATSMQPTSVLMGNDRVGNVWANHFYFHYISGFSCRSGSGLPQKL